MKKELTGWWLFYLILTILTVIAISFLSYTAIFTKTVVERKVFEQSYQKQAGDNKRLATYKAQLAQVNSKLSETLSDGVRQDLLAQKAMLEVQIRSTK